MKKILISIISIFLFFSFPLQVFSETIEVLIKGVDDGKKTTKQHDYMEALMNAKLQAIERAGVEIQSITKVENFQLKYDLVESKAKAVLLPGFQVEDMGYQIDGTYQVVLSGKIQVGEGTGIKGKEVFRDRYFIAYDNGTVLDSMNKLMWARKDNGSNINWQNAKSFCENYRGGGYTDWRMPTQDELAELYDKEDEANDTQWGYRVTKLITISGLIWASETRVDKAASFFFLRTSGSYNRRGWEPKSDGSFLRALPVRSVK